MKNLSTVALSLVIAAFAGSASADEPTPAPAPSAAPAPAPSPRDRFAGSFTFGGAEAEKKARVAAIEKSVDGIFFAVRGIAKGKVETKTVIRQDIGFSFAGGNITTTSSGANPATSPESGASVPYKSGDDTVQLSQKFNAQGQLVQTFQGSEGGRTNVYTLSADGRTLTLSVTLTSSKLSVPCRYNLTYVRKG